MSAVFAYFGEKRTRRRTLYGEAYRAALAWREMLYRIRRRRRSDDAEDALITAFRDLQLDIDYHTGWIGSESNYVQRSYACLVRQVKAVTSPLIQQAWDASPPARPSWSDPDAEHPDVSAAARSFLFDVRCHLAWWQLPKLLVVLRNREWLRRSQA
ncbi:hypothetical protein [Geodermatophilus sp. SYSU D01105]